MPVTFDSPLLLALSPLVALVVGLLAWWLRRRRITRARAWSPVVAERARGYGRTAPFALGLAALAAGVALAGPRGGRTTVTAESRALSLVMAVDISRSMLAEDVDPSRLERAKREARRLVQDTEGDRIGLLAFAGRSYILSPLTVDVGAIMLYLDALDPDLASEGGTSLEAVLAQGRGLLEASSDPADRVLVVFTDGETHDSLPGVLEQATRLGEAGVRLILVGEGTAEGTRIPIRDSLGTLLEYKLDENGQPVVTSLEGEDLRRIADAAEGSVIGADVPDQAGALRQLLSAFKRAPTRATQASDLKPMAWLPALIAAVLLLLHTFTRRGASLVILAGLMVVGSAEAQLPSPGRRALEAGHPAEAASRYLKGAGTSMADTAWYNAGTAAMAAGNLDVARRALTEASRSLDPNLRYRALYNLGVIDLLLARTDTANATAHLEGATQSLKDALLLQPGSERAKWNLELARQRRPPDQSGGGGGQSPPSSGGGGGPPPPAQDQEQPSGLSEQDAERILGSVEREERETRARRARAGRVSTAGVKDW